MSGTEWSNEEHDLIAELRNMLADILSQVTPAEEFTTICYKYTGDAEELIMKIRGDSFRIRVDMVPPDYIGDKMGQLLVEEIEEVLRHE